MPTLEPGGLAVAFITEASLSLIVLVFAVGGTYHEVVHGLKSLGTSDLSNLCRLLTRFQSETSP